MKVKAIIGCIICSFISASCFFATPNVEQQVEKTALSFLISLLNEPSLYTSKAVILPYGFEQDMGPFKKGEYYSNGKLCLISNPYHSLNSPIVGYSRTNLMSFRSFKDSINTVNYDPPGLDIENLMQIMNYSDYLKSKKDSSYFFTIRHHLQGRDLTLVQIHLTPYAKADNPFEYAFHIFMDGNKIVDWKISLETNFDEIDC